MDQKQREHILNTMAKISEIVDAKLEEGTQTRENMSYYKNFAFEGNRRIEIENVYIVEISNQKQKEDGDKTEDLANVYEIYNEKGQLIATVSEEGKVHFAKEYLEKLRKFDKQLNLDDVNFELPEELNENDIVMTNEELKEHKQREEQEGAVEEKKSEEKQNEKEDKEEGDKETEEEKIAELKGILPQNILRVRENSNFYEDHPELEPNLYFYKDSDGIVRAEYLDENGNPQPSKYFELSQTALRQETVAMGNDGNPVVREVPYQVIQTKNLSGTDKDIRDIRININIDSYGYLEISEARQGANGMWASHDIEVWGRDYNSYELNRATSIETRMADPDRQTDAYEKIEDTKLIEDGVQYHEMYLMQHADEIIQEFVDEGYNRDEAIQIFNLMIGEEALPKEEAKSRVNEQIKEKEEKEQSKESDSRTVEEDEGRTPWGDAASRRNRY